MSDDYDHDDGPLPGLRVLRSSRHVARVAHDCDGCHEAGGIKPDVPYAQVIELDWGRFAIRRYCLDGCCRPDEALPPRPPAPVYGPDELPF